MKRRALVLFFAVSSVSAFAQTTNTPAPATTNAPASQPAVLDVPQPVQPAQPDLGPEFTTTDPAKMAEFQRRFAQGKELEKEGKLPEALAVFDGIIADAPDAKGSLREAGMISYYLGDLTHADEYFDKLHRLMPEYPAALEALIQVNQALKRDVKVAILNKQFHDLRAAGKVPNPYFIRERIDLGQGNQLVMTEFFDYKQAPNTVWTGEVFNSDRVRERWFLLNYDPDATAELRAKDAKLAEVKAEVFDLYEYVLKDDKPVEVDVYKNYVGLPDYRKTRLDILGILTSPTKPIYSAPVPPSAQ